MQESLCTLFYDGRPLTGPANIPLIDFLTACDVKLPHVCYHPVLEPMQTCDVCWVEYQGEL
ncbi:(2Fe-2S)-binding protein, partial [Leptospira borgpetersenii serovar Ballum]|nr:(2Fe-2S)-binding protein [Leptospira borgpetersenii serovar Ballum]